MRMAGNSAGSACAACKFLRRKCTAQCLFAPYFPPDQPQKFANVHKIFGVANITKLLSELPLHQREDAVNSLAYEADARVKDPVYGCVGAISVLQQQVAQLSADLAIANAELARYQQRGPAQGGLQQQAGPSDPLAFATLAGTMAALGGMQGQGGSVGPLQRPPHGRQS
ncbi:Lateral organ boundaries (LOB) domain-containing protein [Klebsormidium nitens]|uniref:Lateral organ boundaries (LOB) domain-containing protein n=1 Tax=Klebsormidium nitens TaxID=105231 RepID=A0A1Y1I1S1_KLENI|nr:Lateral organ boundaries (LOB) domain-containing protein [Klebsormidium nitens]|eukprot:GAQ84864.1 Lateral organ boundaries (LOB) domain-containing protein [Klebsormidium nitens]